MLHGHHDHPTHVVSHDITSYHMKILEKKLSSALEKQKKQLTQGVTKLVCGKSYDVSFDVTSGWFHCFVFIVMIMGMIC